MLTFCATALGIGVVFTLVSAAADAADTAPAKPPAALPWSQIGVGAGPEAALASRVTLWRRRRGRGSARTIRSASTARSCRFIRAASLPCHATKCGPDTSGPRTRPIWGWTSPPLRSDASARHFRWHTRNQAEASTGAAANWSGAVFRPCLCLGIDRPPASTREAGRAFAGGARSGRLKPTPPRQQRPPGRWRPPAS